MTLISSIRNKIKITSTSSALKTPFPPCRFIFVAMGFFAIINVYTLRVTLNVAVVDMVNWTWVEENKIVGNKSATNVSSTACVAKKTNKTDGEFQWDSDTQLLITGSFYYGYIATQFVGGMLAQKFGGKYVILIGLGTAAVLTLLTPVVTENGGYRAMIGLRVVEGLFEGVCFPSTNAILSNWAPPLERTMMSSVIYAGAQIGTIIGNALTGALGWRKGFYFFGGLGIIWAIMWFCLVYNTPLQHPRISEVERNYIINSLPPAKKRSLRVPWCSLLRSGPFWAVAAAHFACLWGYYTLLNTLPQYFKNILKFDIGQNGALSGAPYIVMWFMMLLTGYVADTLRSKKIMSTTNIRKTCFTIGFIIPSACLIGVGFVDCHESYIAVILIIIAVGANGAAFVSWNVNHLDFAPAYAGTLMGITNTLGTIPGFVGTQVVGAFTSKNQTVEGWRNVFYVTAGINVFGTIVFLIFGSGEPQSWAQSPPPAGDDKTGNTEPQPVEIVTDVEASPKYANMELHAYDDDNNKIEPDGPPIEVSPSRVDLLRAQSSTDLDVAEQRNGGYISVQPDPQPASTVRQRDFGHVNEGASLDDSRAASYV